MRVAIDARVLERPEFAERGIGRYAGSLLDALMTDGRPVIALRNLRRPNAKLAEPLEHALLGRDAVRAGADLLHSPSIDFATLRPRMPYVVTVHDLVPLKYPERYLRTGALHRLRYAATKRATRLIVPTEAVAFDCERLLGVDRSCLDVIAEAAAPVFRRVADPRPLLHRFNLPPEYLLWVGGLDPPDPRKGLHALAEAAARRDGLPLVLAGRVGPEAAGLATRGRVILLGRPTDEELAGLYTAATAAVLPSSEEGFGLTAREALACGTPVAAFAIEAMIEQYADTSGVTLVDPGDYDALLEAAEALAGTTPTPPRRTWADVAAETWRTYEAALAY
jgi:glycosyltransferase involved in cell wall biosynthesis